MEKKGRPHQPGKYDLPSLHPVKSIPFKQALPLRIGAIPKKAITSSQVVVPGSSKQETTVHEVSKAAPKIPPLTFKNKNT